MRSRQKGLILEAIGWGMVSVSLVVYLLLYLTACTSVPMGGWGDQGTDDDTCPVVRVQNNAYADIIVRHDVTGLIRWEIPGYTSRIYRTCTLVGHPSHFLVDPIGERFPFPVEGHTTLDFGSDVSLIIEMARRQSRVIGGDHGG